MGNESSDVQRYRLRRGAATAAERATLAGGGDLQLAHGRRLVGVDRRVLSQTHDLKRLLNDRGQAAKGDGAAFFRHFLDDLDEDADSDRVDDLGFAKIEEKCANAGVDELVGPGGDLFTADVVD